MTYKDFYKTHYSWSEKNDSSNKASWDYELWYLKKIIDSNTIKSVIDIWAWRWNMLDRFNKNLVKKVWIELLDEWVNILKSKWYEAYKFDVWSENIEPLWKFDLILSFHVLEHIFWVDNFIQNIKKISHDNTIIVLEVPNLGWRLSRLLLLFWYTPFNAVENHDLYVNFWVPRIIKYKLSKYISAWHIRWFTLVWLKDLLEFYWFNIIKIEWHWSESFIPKSLSKWIRFYCKIK